MSTPPRSMPLHGNIPAQGMEKLADEWLDQASRDEARGLVLAASLMRAAVSEMLARINDLQSEALTLSQAAEESGYSRDHLRRLLRSGRLSNAGEKGKLMVLRRTLPLKPALVPHAIPIQLHGPSRQQVVRSLRGKRG